MIFFDEPHAADDVSDKAARQKLTEIMHRLRPTEVYTLHEELDRHPAHRLAGKLVRERVVETGLTPSGGLWAYEIWGPFAGWNRERRRDNERRPPRLASQPACADTQTGGFVATPSQIMRG